MLYCGRKKLTLKINSLCLILIAEVQKEILSGDDCVSVQQAQEGDEVTVHYEGRLASNNFKFDSSFDRGQPISFILGQNKVIQGWDQGLVGICPGNQITVYKFQNFSVAQSYVKPSAIFGNWEALNFEFDV